MRFAPSQSLLLAAGIAAPVVYGLTVGIGGAIKPGYDPQAEAISALLIGPRAGIIGPFFIAYNLLMLAFAWGIHDALRNPDRRFVAGAALLAFSGLLGLWWTPRTTWSA